MKAWSTAAAVAIFSLALEGSAAAQTQSLTLAWDANPETFVAGFIVYVGPASGTYDEQFDVGNRQSFVYDRVISGRAYFFAVAAYSAGPVIGPRSEEIFYRAGAIAPSHTMLRTR